MLQRKQYAIIDLKNLKLSFLFSMIFWCCHKQTTSFLCWSSKRGQYRRCVILTLITTLILVLFVTYCCIIQDAWSMKLLLVLLFKQCSQKNAHSLTLVHYNKMKSGLLLSVLPQSKGCLEILCYFHHKFEWFKEGAYLKILSMTE